MNKKNVTAFFDRDGVCLAVSAGAAGNILYVKAIFVPQGTQPSDVYWDGGNVARKTKETTLKLPNTVKLGDPAISIPLPAGVIALVNGVRQRGQLILPTSEVKTFMIDIRGAEVGQFVVAVQSFEEQRKGEYPAIADQLDMLYHLGYDGWKAEIKKIKDKYPKP